MQKKKKSDTGHFPLVCLLIDRVSCILYLYTRTEVVVVVGVVVVGGGMKSEEKDFVASLIGAFKFDHSTIICIKL